MNHGGHRGRREVFWVVACFCGLTLPHPLTPSPLTGKGSEAQAAFPVQGGGNGVGVIPF